MRLLLTLLHRGGAASHGTPSDLVGLLVRYSNRTDLIRTLSDLHKRLEHPADTDEAQPRQVATRQHTKRPLRHRLGDADIEQLVEQYRLGATGAELATRFGISLSSVKRLLHDRGARHSPKLTARQTDAVFASYRAGVGPRELSRRYGLTERAVKYLLQKHDVQRQRAEVFASCRHGMG